MKGKVDSTNSKLYVVEIELLIIVGVPLYCSHLFFIYGTLTAKQEKELLTPWEVSYAAKY